MVLVAAAQRLATVLEAENAALLVLDIPGAAALLPEKLAAAAALTAATAARPAGRHTPVAAGLAIQVRDLAERNRSLLEHALAVQGRVLDLVASAARQQDGRADGRYSAGGTAANPRGTADRGAAALHMRA